MFILPSLQEEYLVQQPLDGVRIVIPPQFDNIACDLKSAIELFVNFDRSKFIQNRDIVSEFYLFAV